MAYVTNFMLIALGFNYERKCGSKEGSPWFTEKTKDNGMQLVEP